MSGPTYLKRVMEGQHDLTDSSIAKFSQALELNSLEAEFFSCLVHFNQARTLDEKDRHFHRLMALKSPHSEHVLEQSQYEYYRDWFNIALREMLAFTPYNGDPAELAKKLSPPVLPKKVKRAMELLESLGLISRGDDGYYRTTDNFILTQPGIESLLLPKFHQSMARLAQEAITRFPKSERYFSGSTVSISEPTYEAIIEIIRSARKDILKRVADDPEPNRVYHLNMQLFPLTALPPKRGRKKK